MTFSKKKHLFRGIIELIFLVTISQNSFSQALVGRIYSSHPSDSASTNVFLRSLLFVDDSTCVFKQSWPQASTDVSIVCRYYVEGGLLELTDTSIHSGDHYESSRLVHWKDKVAADSIALKGVRLPKLSRRRHIETVDNKYFNQQIRELNKLFRSCFSKGRLVRPAYEELMNKTGLIDYGVILYPYHDILMIENDVIEYYVSMPTRVSPFSDEVGGEKRERVLFYEQVPHTVSPWPSHKLKSMKDSSIIWNDYRVSTVD